jgi:hypothetical protein
LGADGQRSAVLCGGYAGCRVGVDVAHLSQVKIASPNPQVKIHKSNPQVKIHNSKPAAQNPNVKIGGEQSFLHELPARVA